MQEVRGSIPLGSTKSHPNFCDDLTGRDAFARDT